MYGHQILQSKLIILCFGGDHLGHLHWWRNILTILTTFLSQPNLKSLLSPLKRKFTQNLYKNRHHQKKKMSLKNPLGTSFISSLVIGFIWMVKWMVPNGFLFLFFLINSSLLASCKAKVNSSFLQKQKCALRKWYFLLHLSSQENYQQNATILKSFYFCILKDLRLKFKTPTYIRYHYYGPLGNFPLTLNYTCNAASY